MTEGFVVLQSPLSGDSAGNGGNVVGDSVGNGGYCRRLYRQREKYSEVLQGKVERDEILKLKVVADSLVEREKL